MQTKKASLIPLLFGSYYVIFFYGSYIALLGFMLPQIKADFNVSYTASGLVFLLPLVPGIFGNFFAGYIFTKFDRKKVLIGICTLMIIVYLLLPLSSSYFIFLVFNLLLSTIVNLMNTMSNITISDVFTLKYPRYRDNGILMVHFLFSFGSVLAILLGDILFESKVTWRTIFLIDALISLPVLILFLFSKYPDLKGNSISGISLKDVTALLYNRKMIFFLICALFYVGAEDGIVNWTSTFLENGHGHGKSFSSLALMLFFILFASGRLLGVLFIQKLNPVRAILVLIGLGASSVALEVFTGLTLFGVDVFIPFCGILLSIVFPTIQNLLIKEFKDNISVATGILFAASSVGGTLMTFLIGVSNDFIGDKYGFVIISVYLVMVVPFLVSIRYNGHGAPDR